MDEVQKAWLKKREYLAEVQRWHSFQREAKQILAAITAKKSTLRQAEVDGLYVNLPLAVSRLWR